MSKLVRLYPYNKKKGWVIRSINHPIHGKFLGIRGWYKVSDEVAEELSTLTQKSYKPNSGPAFLIARDIEEARKLELTIVDYDEEETRVGTAEEPVETKIFRPGKSKPRRRSKRSTTAG